MAQMDEFIRFCNKLWADGISQAEASEDESMRAQTLADAAYLLWICTLLMHPIVPHGCEDICEKMGFAPTSFFDWNHDFLSLAELDPQAQWHTVEELEPRYDFF